MNEHIQKQLEKASAEIKMSLSNYINHPINELTLNSMVAQMRRYILATSLGIKEDLVKFRVTQNHFDKNKIDVRPLNIYTLILLTGKMPSPLPPEMDKGGCLDKYVDPEDEVEYGFDMKGQPYIKPAKPLEYVDITFKIT